MHAIIDFLISAVVANPACNVSIVHFLVYVVLFLGIGSLMVSPGVRDSSMHAVVGFNILVADILLSTSQALIFLYAMYLKLVPPSYYQASVLLVCIPSIE